MKNELTHEYEILLQKLQKMRINDETKSQCIHVEDEDIVNQNIKKLIEEEFKKPITLRQKISNWWFRTRTKIDEKLGRVIY